ncbi:MAG: hypothetical protein ABIH11_03195 [Candidatus Altiarchaeota archaeon]
MNRIPVEGDVTVGIDIPTIVEGREISDGSSSSKMPLVIVGVVAVLIIAYTFVSAPTTESGVNNSVDSDVMPVRKMIYRGSSLEDTGETSDVEKDFLTRYIIEDKLPAGLMFVGIFYVEGDEDTNTGFEFVVAEYDVDGKKYYFIVSTKGTYYEDHINAVNTEIKPEFDNMIAKTVSKLGMPGYTWVSEDRLMQVTTLPEEGRLSEIKDFFINKYPPTKRLRV